VGLAFFTPHSNPLLASLKIQPDSTIYGYTPLDADIPAKGGGKQLV